MQKTSCPVTSIGEIAEFLGVESWRVARLFELGILPEPPRVANRRAIPKAMVSLIVDALRQRRWLQGQREEVGHAD